MDIGKYSSFSPQANLEATSVQEQDRAPSSDAKTSSVFLASKKAEATFVNGKSRTHSLAPKNQVVQQVITSIKNVFSTKVSLKDVPPKLRSFFSGETIQRHLFLKAFKQELEKKKDKQSAFQATLNACEKADRAGLLDRGLLKRMTGELEKALSKKAPIELEEAKSVHEELLALKKAPSLSRLDSYVRLNELATNAKTNPKAFKEALVASFSEDSQSLQDIPKRAADDLLEAKRLGVLDIALYKAIVTTGAQAANSPNFHNDVIVCLQQRGETRLAKDLERYHFHESLICSLDQMDIYAKEFAENPKNMSLQHAWVQENCPRECLVNFPEVPTQETWAECLSALRGALQEALVKAAKSNDPDLAKMLAFGGRAVGDLGESLRSATKAREAAFSRLAFAPGLQNEVLHHLLSDVSNITSNEIINARMGVSAGACKVSDVVLINEIPHKVLDVQAVGNNQTLIRLEGPDGREHYVTKNSADMLVKVRINPYNRQGGIMALQAAKEQIGRITELATGEVKKEAEQALEQVNGKIEAMKQAEIQKFSAVDRELVQKAMSQFPALNEHTFEHDGKMVTAILVPTDKNGVDVLIKKEEIGRGAASVVYLAHSLSSKADVAVKYATELSGESNEEANARANLEYLGAATGIQKPMQHATIRTQDGKKSITIDSYYEYKDFGRNVTWRQFFIHVLHLEEQDFDNEAVKKQAINDYNKGLQALFTGEATREQKLARLKEFSTKEGPILTKLMGQAPVQRLEALYQKLIDETSPA